MSGKCFRVAAAILILSLSLTSMALGVPHRVQDTNNSTNPLQITQKNINNIPEKGASPSHPLERPTLAKVHASAAAPPSPYRQPERATPNAPWRAFLEHQKAHAPLLASQALPMEEPQPFARVHTTWDFVDGHFGSNAHVWFEVRDGGGNLKGSGAGDARDDGWLDGVSCGCDIVPGDPVEIWSDLGFHSVVIPITITGHLDPQNDQVSGQMTDGVFPATGGSEAWSEGRFIGLWLDFVTEANGSYLVDFSGQFDVQTGDMLQVWYRDPNGNMSGVTLFALQTQVNYTHDWAYAWTEPNAAIQVEVVGKASLSATADGRGEFRGWEWYDDWTPAPPDINPGDVVTFSAAGFNMELNPVGTIAGSLDIDTETVSGVIQASGLSPGPLRVRCEVWAENAPPGIEQWVDPDGGSYTCDFSSLGFDIQEGMDVAVRYYELDSDQVIRTFQVPRLDLRVNYGHDWVESFFEAGHTVWLTVTEADKTTIKATAMLVTEPKDFWGGQPGFQTTPQDWVPAPPDLQAGNWVFGLVDSGQAAEVQLGDIAGAIDLANDSIQGTIAADWFLPDTVDVECFPWGSPDPNTQMKFDTILPDGSDPYDCSWLGEWDILAGQDVGVGYFGSDHHWVANAFRIPAPWLRINVWGDNSPAVGGNFTFNFDYQNHGEAPAPDTTITAVLSANVSYLGDTSGLPHTGSGTQADPLVWQVGSLAPSRFSSGFMVFVQVNGALGEQIGIQGDIATSLPYQSDPGAIHSEWSTAILANQTDLNIGKWTNTWDPVPGGGYFYTVNVCNNGATASNSLTLTDWLPPQTHLQSWWAQHAGWQEVTFADQFLELSRPSFPGYYCSEVYLQVSLDPGTDGQEITNTAEVTSTSDLDPNNNQTSVTHGTGSPHVNLFLQKDWRSGLMVPGGEIFYEMNYMNTGNVPVQNVVFSGQLPKGAVLVGAWEFTRHWQFLREVFPIVDASGAFSWLHGDIPNGLYGNYQIAVRIDPAALPGDPLDMTVQISPQPIEDNMWDNEIAWHDTVNPLGPNLQLDKHNYYWEWKERIWWELRILNLGSERLENVLLTDTLPVGTQLDGWGMGHGPETDLVSYDPLTRQAVFWISGLWPGETESLVIYARLDENLVDVQGRTFTNTISGPIPGDVNPADNSAAVSAYSGPDLYAEKWLVEGAPTPGGTLKFLVRMGNANKWPWEVSDGANVQLLERVPQGTSFEAAYWPDGTEFTPSSINPNNGVVTWDLGRLWAPDLRWFYLELKLASNLPAGRVLRDLLQIREAPPALDTDPVGSNNVDVYLIRVEKP